MLERPMVSNDGTKRNKTINNTDSDKIIITKDKLYRKLNEYKECIEHKNSVYTFLGIFVSLLIPFITCEFKDVLGLTADTWKGIVLLACIMSGTLLLISIVRAFRYRKVNTKELIKRICEKDELD